jgi:uncharacterized protein YxeA
MKKIICSITGLIAVLNTYAQTYPEPEYTNEVYYLKKDSVYSLTRLEKNSAKSEQHNNMLSGSEVSNVFDGGKSPVRFQKGSNLFFIFSTGTAATTGGNNQSDSMMKANGMDPNMMTNMMGGMTDPATNITLYKLNISKGIRKIITMKAPGMSPFGNHKVTSSDKYTFSVKKIKEGYWVLQIDKTLPSGEYAFALSGMMGGMGSMMGQGMVVYAFGVD